MADEAGMENGENGETEGELHDQHVQTTTAGEFEVLNEQKRRGL